MAWRDTAEKLEQKIEELTEKERVYYTAAEAYQKAQAEYTAINAEVDALRGTFDSELKLLLGNSKSKVKQF